MLWIIQYEESTTDIGNWTRFQFGNELVRIGIGPEPNKREIVVFIDAVSNFV
jgi:hypothetical protein